MNYVTTFDPSNADIDLLIDGLNAHSVEHVRRSGFDPAAIFVRDADEEIRGGILAYLNWNWLDISLLWIDDALRGGGYGKKLMQDMEALGVARGCRHAHLDTFSFQAKAFYESLGYEVFASLSDYPPGHARYFLKKSLSPTEAGGR